MCGILFTNDSNVTRDTFCAGLELMKHRGPEASGYWHRGPNQLGQNRLKIIDLDDRANQPFWSSDGRYGIIYNGEVYNYQELASEYGIQQQTSCDTEVVVELYSRRGAACLDLLEGMFAFVILDTRDGGLFIARDRLGVKPLYVCRRNGHVTVASEIAAILALTGTPKFDDFGLRQYRKLRTFFNGRTIYSGIEMFPAGHYEFNGTRHCYWTLPEHDQLPPSDEELRAMIVDSVKKRRVADVPVGSYLSGGLDSTIIAALAHEPHTWTVGFDGHNEFEWADMAAKRIGSIHHEVVITDEEFVDLAAQMVRKRGEPLSVPNEVLLFRMTQEVKKFNTVVLSGEGADELFFGYDRIFRWADAAESFDIKEFDRLYSYGSNDDLEVIEDALSPFLGRGSAVAIVAAFFQVAHLHGLLRRVDNSTMICSVEARVPFVDNHQLIERMAGVPFSYRMENGVIKAPLKRVFANELPSEIIHRKKVGFPVPLNQLQFGEHYKGSPMDQWLQFNLGLLGA